MARLVVISRSWPVPTRPNLSLTPRLLKQYDADRFYSAGGEPMQWLKDRLSSAKNWFGEKWKAILIAGCIVAFVAFIVWKVPEWQVRAYHGRLDANAISKLDPKDLIQLQKDLITAENNARVTIAQIIGGVVVLLGLYATF